MGALSFSRTGGVLLAVTLATGLLNGRADMPQSRPFFSLEYMGTNGIPHTATLKHVHSGTTEPFWIVVNAQNGDTTEVEWLPYLTQDSSEWKAKATCHETSGPPGPAAGPYVYCNFKHVRVDGSGGHGDNMVWFLDWQRKPRLVQIQTVERPYGTQPTFRFK